MEKALVIISNYYIDNQGTFSYFVTLQPQTLIYFIWILCENQNKDAYSSEAESYTWFKPFLQLKNWKVRHALFSLSATNCFQKLPDDW